MTKSISPSIFISYSHRDQEWKDRLVISLGMMQREGLLDIWNDSRIKAGSNWKQEIEKAIKNAKIIILLISADYLASDFVTDFEFPKIIKQQSESGSVVLPVLIRPSTWSHVKWLRDFQIFPPDLQPLSSGSDFETDVNFATLAEKVVTLLEITEKTIVDRKPFTELIEKETKIDVFISHDSADGDFAELLKLKIEKEGLSAWIDVDRLNAGEDWRQEIDTAIKNSRTLIVVMSQETRKSEYVTYEWAFAYGAGIKIIPLLIKQTQLHPKLESLQYLDFTNRRARPWNKLIDLIKRV